MADRFRAISIKPSAAGRLITSTSVENCGLLNYSNKRDFRRLKDREIRAEGHDWFRPNVSIAIGDQPYPFGSSSADPVILLAEAKQPNGRKAIVAGNRTSLWRFFALDDGDYFEGDGTPAEYFVTSPPGPGVPYFDDSPGVWIKIGDGFSSAGKRWEFESLNGYLILNNSVDLPVTYRVEEFEVVPIYELRDAGIASVGTMAIENDILLLGDISEISDDGLDDIRTPTDPGASVTASQVGAQWSNPITATLSDGVLPTNAGNVVTASGAFFDVGMVGKTIRFQGGLRRAITAFTDPTHVTVGGTAYNINPGEMFYILNSGTTDFTVTASSPVFSADQVGLFLFWDSGEVRTITAFVDAQTVVVDSDESIAAGHFTIQNPLQYAAYTDQSNIDRIQYRFLSGMIDQPRRWGAVVPGSINAGSNILTFDFPTTSFESGQEILVLGAGVDAGNLTAVISFIGPDGKVAILDTAASTAVTSQDVSGSDVSGSTISFEDLTSEDGAIIRMLDLRGTLVIYQDIAITLAQYTTIPATPWKFQRIYTGFNSIHYKHTLVNVNGLFHLYAGRSKFYTFDLTNQVPVESQPMSLCDNIFFENADLSDDDFIFASDNALSKEIFVCFPSDSGPDYAICYDYVQGTARTSGSRFTAAITVQRPQAGIATGSTQEWFIMGSSDGKVVRFGLTDAKPRRSGAVTASQAGNTVTVSGAFFTTKDIGKSIIFADDNVSFVQDITDSTHVTVGGPSKIVTAQVFTIVAGMWNRLGEAYESVIANGLSDFNNSAGEKQIESITVLLSSKSINAEMTLDVFGATNTVNGPEQLASVDRTNLRYRNLFPLHYKRFYLSDKITVGGLDAPCELSEKIYNVMGSKSSQIDRDVRS